MESIIAYLILISVFLKIFCDLRIIKKVIININVKNIKMIITISGLHGTGKSTVVIKIAEILGLKSYSTGQAFRDLANEKNMSLEKFTKYVEKNPNLGIDKILDEKVLEVAKKGNVIVDSQIGAYFLEDIADFKILLICSMEERVKRMANRDSTTYEGGI